MRTEYSIVKEKGKKLLPRLAITFLILLLIFLFHLSFWWLLLVINLIVIARSLYQKKTLKQISLGCASTTSLLLLLWGVNRTLGTVSAVLAFIIIVLGLTAFLLWKQKDAFIDGMRTIETQIWGKPLDQFKKGELRRRKNEKRTL